MSRSLVLVTLLTLIGGLAPTTPATGQGRGPGPGVSIDRVTPGEASWGDRVVISGRGFGTDPGAVAFGGELSQGIYSWEDTRIDVRVPSQTPPGEASVEVFPATRRGAPPVPDAGLQEDLASPPAGQPVVGGPIRVRNHLLPGEKGTFIPGEIVLRVVEGAGAAAVLERLGLRGRRLASDPPPGSGLSNHLLATVRPGEEARRIVEASRDPDVAWAGPHGALSLLDATPNDMGEAGSQWGLEKIDIVRAWGFQKARGGVEVGVIDTGVKANHEDLASEILSPLRDFTGTGAADDCGHGTHVAGIAAAATNNGKGVAGTGWATKLRSYRVLADACQGSTGTAEVVDAINQAVADGVEVINISLGTPEGACPDELQAAITAAARAGRLVVAAGGNENSISPGFPANCQHVIAVAATGMLDEKATFSNFGPMIDLAAPGLSILSTAMAGGDVCGGSSGEEYATCSGTSMAAPFVAGTAALLYAHGAARSEVVAALLDTADLIICACGEGRLNAGEALAVNELTHWKPWRGLGGRTRAAPDAASWGPDHVDIVVLGENTDAVYYKRWDRGWSGWTSLGEPGTGEDAGAATAPSAVSWGPGRTDVFVVGKDGALWHSWYAGGRWHAWKSRGKPGSDLVSAPDAASMDPGHLEVFANDKDGNLRHIRWNGSEWESWRMRGIPSGGIASAPTATSWGPNRMDVFVRNGNDEVAQILFNGAWRSWRTFTTTATSALDVAAWSGNRLDTFFHEGEGTALKRWWWDGVSWSHTEGYGGRLYSTPGVASMHEGRLDVFVQGSTGEIWQRWRGP